MKCLRKAVNKTRRDKIRNEVIRDMAGAKPVLQHIKQQIKWFRYFTRMPINQPTLRSYNAKYSGWRARGRPRKRWSDSVADTLRTNNNNNRIQRRNSRFLTISSLRRELSLKWPGRICVQITCHTSSAYHVQHVVLRATWYEGTSQLLNLTEFEIAYI